MKPVISGGKNGLYLSVYGITKEDWGKKIQVKNVINKRNIVIDVPHTTNTHPQVSWVYFFSEKELNYLNTNNKKDLECIIF